MGLNICFSRFDGNALDDNRDDHTDRAKNNTEQPQLPTQRYGVCKGSKKLHYNYLEYDGCCQYTDKDPIFQYPSEHVDLFHFPAIYLVENLEQRQLNEAKSSEQMQYFLYFYWNLHHLIDVHS